MAGEKGGSDLLSRAYLRQNSGKVSPFSTPCVIVDAKRAALRGRVRTSGGYAQRDPDEKISLTNNLHRYWVILLPKK